jgi:circadian clock protein KaiC
MSATENRTSGRIGTGVPGLDEILGGGLPGGRMYLVNGDPGTGKTTLSLQFLKEGDRLGETSVYVTLSETEAELREIAHSHGWDLGNVTVVDLQSAEESLGADAQYTLFHPADVELSETTKTVLETVERIQPARVVFDSLSEMRLLARDSLRYRRQILALKHYFSGRGATVLLLDTRQEMAQDFALESVAHGVLSLQQLAPEYGGPRRRLRIQKVRGIEFRAGFHDFTIERGGIRVYPRLAAEYGGRPEGGVVASGLGQLDALVGGGIERGTATLLLGPSGVGKSTIATLYAAGAASRGERASVYLFDEEIALWTRRARAVGLPIDEQIRAGTLAVRPVNPAELAPGQFAHLVRESVERDGARVVVIDTLNGFQKAMPAERYLGLHLHELLSYLGRRGVLTMLVLAQHGILGDTVTSDEDLSYIADTVILLRYFEVHGAVRKAISVVKKRSGGHETTVRELRVSPGGVQVGAVIEEFTGVLTGRLEFTGSSSRILGDRDARR